MSAVVSLDDLRAQVEILKWCKAKRAEIKELEDNAKEAVQAALGDNEAGTVDGELAVTWKVSKRTALDQAYLKKTFPEVAAECQVTSEVRRFEVSE